ncbi:hypothetical protein Tco_0619641 [Tanacetum coccineum]
MSESTKRHEENSNLIREIRASTEAAIRTQRASIKTMSILTTVEADASSIRRIGSHQYVVSTGQNSTLMYKTRQTTILFLSRLNDCYCEEKKDHMDRNFRKLTHMELHISINPYPERRKTRDFTYNLIYNNFGLIMPLPTRSYLILEDMDAYCDEGMGDVIFGKQFPREVGINARRFEGIITIYNGNKEVTYQMVRSHPRFKRPTNKQCNKISPLLKDLRCKEIDKVGVISTTGNLEELES